ncbi:MAG: B12-binding domain-containing radical SAM protein [Candidatus Riflebacteria bacterium]|nr:B12-binding domain-containing radical SAM protein [Candidatus Riflebacteria bacterium]
MKVVLIHGKYFNSWEALGLAYIGAYLKANMENIEIDFYQGCFDSIDTIISGCRGADFVAFSCTTPTFPFALNVSSELKKIFPSIKTVVGGYHPSAAPNECQLDNIDHVIIGEGEAAMLDLLKASQEKVIMGRTMDFCELPWPDRELIKNERNIQVAYRDNKKRITSFQSHRGCPFMCKYCADGYFKVLYGSSKEAPVRYRSVGDLLDEMQHVAKEYKLDLMKFTDPTWNTNINWVKEFCKEKIRRNFSVPFYPNIHAGVCTEEMFQLMAEANCYEIAVGIESGSQKILDQIGKGTTVEKIKNSVMLAKKAKLLVRGYFILGMPEENEEDLMQTEKLAEELELDEYGFTILCPYPGTQMYDLEKFKSINWENADEYSNDFWSSNHVKNNRLKEWQTHFIQKFKKKLTWHNLAIDKHA